MEISFRDFAGIIVAVIVFSLLYVCLSKMIWDCCRWIKRSVVDYFRTRNHVPLSNAQSTQSMNQPQSSNGAAATQVSAPTTGPRRRKTPPQLENISLDNVNKDLRDEKVTGGDTTADGGNDNVKSDTSGGDATDGTLHIGEEDIVIFSRGHVKLNQSNAADNNVLISGSNKARTSIVYV